MPKPRKSQIAVESTPYYHVVSRCVRRAFLCGEDRYTSKSYDHLRAFLEKELLRLSEVFYLDVVAYSLMSNQYHVVLFIDQEAMKTADANEVVSRWHQIHKGNPVSAKFLEGDASERHEIDQLNITWTGGESSWLALVGTCEYLMKKWLEWPILKTM